MQMHDLNWEIKCEREREREDKNELSVSNLIANIVLKLNLIYLIK